MDFIMGPEEDAQASFPSIYQTLPPTLRSPTVSGTDQTPDKQSAAEIDVHEQCDEVLIQYSCITVLNDNYTNPPPNVQQSQL